ncbi:LrgB family protein [Paraburkholderia adhaesiva]|uniref:LrgB family protein n=1 Tax=Paraburkholderia adhaesiva TaxID=2883244 RepID=UPI001F38ADEA|nr:LrgB family protein [Paraburkholderia adhaesiva]
MMAFVVGMAATLAVYLLNVRLHRAWRNVLTSPLLLAPVVLIAGLSLLHVPFDAYLQSTHMLVWMVGPLTLALAVPVYQNRHFVRHWWPVLLVGTIVSGTTAMVSTVVLARLFDLPAIVEHSLVGRSISMPFAFVVSDELSGARDLTTLFVVASGVAGIVLGDLLLMVFRVKSAQAHGATLGAVAQMAGTLRAHDRGMPNGVMASLTMVLGGAFTVLAAPLVVRLI